MPELPEVETIRRDLDSLLSKKTIDDISLKKRKMVRGNPAAFKRALKGLKITGVERRGKLLIITFEDRDKYLLIHLKMTGQLIYRQGKKAVGGGHGYPLIETLPNKFSHIVFTFSDQSQLFFNDMRQFGYAQLVGAEQLEAIKGRYGVEPLTKDFTPDLLRQIVGGRRTALKNVLLDQKKIAGLGNIYVDEASFAAGVRPTRRADKLTPAEIALLHRQINAVIRRAIAKRGTTFGDYRDGRGGEGNFVRLLKVYGRAGGRCKKCRGIIKKTKVNGRGTAYCPACQK